MFKHYKFKKYKGLFLGGSLLIALIAVMGWGVAVAGLVERIAALDALVTTERRVYVGNDGTIGMTNPPSAKMSIHYRLSDAKKKNDNGAIGQILEELPGELGTLDLSIADLEPSDNDFLLIEAESLTSTGLGYLDRIEIV